MGKGFLACCRWSVVARLWGLASSAVSADKVPGLLQCGTEFGDRGRGDRGPPVRRVQTLTGQRKASPHRPAAGAREFPSGEVSGQLRELFLLAERGTGHDRRCRFAAMWAPASGKCSGVASVIDVVPSQNQYRSLSEGRRRQVTTLCAG